MRIDRLGPDGAPHVADLLESDPGYTERVLGRFPAPSDGRDLLVGRPDEVADHDKIVIGAWEGRQLIFLADILRHWPQRGTAHIGLLFVRGDRQGTGLGRRTFEACNTLAASWPHVHTWRAGVVRGNAQVAGFWRRQGFRPVDGSRQLGPDPVHSEIEIYTRPVGSLTK